MKIIENYWARKQKIYLRQWQRNIVNLKIKDLSKKYFLINLNNLKQKHSNRLLCERVINKFKKNRDEVMKEKYKIRAMQLSKII